MMNGLIGRRWMMAGLIAVTAGTAGLAGAGWAHNAPALPGMHGHSSMTAMDSAAMDAHFDTMVASLLPDATPQQKERMKTIARSIHAEFGTVHAQLPQAHRRAHELLLSPTVDRVGLETLRMDQLRSFDNASKRIVAGLADAAEVLTPQQRARLAAHLNATGNKGAGR